MTDKEYAIKIYCILFNVHHDRGNANIQGIFDMISTLEPKEQQFLESYYRHRNTYKKIAELFDTTPSKVSNTIMKAKSKLKHESRLKHLKNK